MSYPFGHVVETDGGKDFIFRVLNAPAASFEVVNLVPGRSWKDEGNDHQWFTLRFPCAVDRPIMVEVWSKDRIQVRLTNKRRCLRRFHVHPPMKEYKTEQFGHHTFSVAPTHEVHMVPDEEGGGGWDTVSFGLINRQIAAVPGRDIVRSGKNARPERYKPQWLLQGDFEDIWLTYGHGRINTNGFCPIDPQFWVEGVISDEEVPQKTPTWHALRKCKLPGRDPPDGTVVSSSMSYSLGMGCFTQDKGKDDVVKSIRCMRMGSLLEDATLLALVNDTSITYYEKGWRIHPEVPYWGDSTDGYIVWPEITWDKVPQDVKDHWAKNGVTPYNTPDISHGMLEIKCSDTKLDAPMAGYFMPQCAWHMMCWDEPPDTPNRRRCMYTILLRAQPCGPNPKIHCYFIWRDFDFEKLIVDNVIKGSPYYEADRISEWGQKLRGLDYRYRLWAADRTKERDDKNKYPLDFELSWPCKGVKEYMETIPRQNKEAESIPPGFPKIANYPLEPLLYYEQGEGWIHNYQIVYSKNRSILDALSPWDGGKNAQGIYTEVDLEKKKKKEKARWKRLEEARQDEERIGVRMTHYQQTQKKAREYWAKKNAKRDRQDGPQSLTGWINMGKKPQRRKKIAEAEAAGPLALSILSRSTRSSATTRRPPVKKKTAPKEKKVSTKMTPFTRALNSKRSERKPFIDDEAKQSGPDSPERIDLANESPVPLSLGSNRLPPGKPHLGELLIQTRLAVSDINNHVDRTGKLLSREGALSAIDDLQAAVAALRKAADNER